jgi:hypothetical protein
MCLPLPIRSAGTQMFFANLKVASLWPNQLGTPETASYENRQNCPVPLPRGAS